MLKRKSLNYDKEARKSYEIIYTKVALKFFLKHLEVKTKFEDKIEKMDEYIAQNIDVKQMRGYPNLYRMRIGECRVIYQLINDKVVIVNVLLAGNSGDVYKKM